MRALVLSRNGKGVIVYPNPLVADLMASGIANRIALLRQHRIEPDADMMAALTRLQTEIDDLADAVLASIALLEGRSLAPQRDSLRPAGHHLAHQPGHHLQRRELMRL
jgi:hypothetical protein